MAKLKHFQITGSKFLVQTTLIYQSVLWAVPRKLPLKFEENGGRSPKYLGITSLFLEMQCLLLYIKKLLQFKKLILSVK